jgi:hypothetical protein
MKAAATNPTVRAAATKASSTGPTAACSAGSDRRAISSWPADSSIAVAIAYRWRGDAVEAALAPFDDAERAVIQHFLRRVVDELRSAVTAATIAAGAPGGASQSLPVVPVKRQLLSRTAGTRTPPRKPFRSRRSLLTASTAASASRYDIV